MSTSIKQFYPIIIIGNGDVVRNRLLKVLTKNFKKEDILIYDLEKSSVSHTSNCNYLKDSREILENVKLHSNDETTIFISCPSSYHIEYLKNLININSKLIVCEKPICISKDDLNIVCSLNETEIRKKIFYLSYYVLEKALPFYYFVSRNENYLKYLDIRGDVKKISSSLGNLKEVVMNLIEGKDTRNVEDFGGHLFETFLHNMLLTSLVCENPNTWNILETSNKNDVISLLAKSKGINIKLKQEKNSPFVERNMFLLYENGSLYMDIDEKEMTICSNKENPVYISIKKDFYDKYSIQEDLVERTLNGEFLPNKVDGLINQAEVLTFLIENKDLF